MTKSLLLCAAAITVFLASGVEPVSAAEAPEALLERSTPARTCIFCQQCADPDQPRTNQHWTEGVEIEWIELWCNTTYQCTQALECLNEQQDEQLEEQMAYMAAAVRSDDLGALKSFVEGRSSVELVPDRQLLVLRSGCGSRIVALQELDARQVTFLMAGRLVALVEE